jgi:hypothetical protein
MILRSNRSLAAAVRAFVAGAALLAVIGAWAACGRAAPTPLAAAGRATGPGSSAPAPRITSAAATRQACATAGLETACIVAQLTHLVDQRRLVAARRLLAGRRVWPRHELLAIRHIRFISARVWGDPRADSVTLAATVCLAVRPGSPLPGGLTTLFFTLGRDGTAGDWLVTAVTTSP